MAAKKTKAPAQSGTRQLRLGDTKEVPELGLSEIEVQKLVGRGAVMDSVKKSLDGELKEIKQTLLDYAKQESLKKLESDDGTVEVQRSSSTEIKASAFLRLLHKLGKLNLLDGLMSVKVGDAKKVLGEDALKGIMKTDSEEYGKLKFKISGRAKVSQAVNRVKEIAG